MTKADSKPSPNRPFWQEKSLAEMTKAEWESLCDGCGHCCLHKIEDTRTGFFYCTNIACHLLDISTAKCSDYANRQRRVPDCVALSPDMIGGLGWLPPECAYRRIEEGRGLASWHPLVSGTQDSVVAAGESVIGQVVSEADYNDPDHALDQWMAEDNQPLWVQPPAITS